MDTKSLSNEIMTTFYECTATRKKEDVKSYVIKTAGLIEAEDLFKEAVRIEIKDDGIFYAHMGVLIGKIIATIELLGIPKP